LPFDEQAASRAVNFFGRALTHAQGQWAGQPFRLLPWQEHEIIRPLFGTLRDDGLRQYRTCYVEVPRKNGKTTLAAGLALYLLMADNEPGAQVYCAASDRDQASLVFNAAAQMVRQSSVLASRCKVIDSTKRIVLPGTASFYRAIPADAGGAHGLNASGVVVDEVHVQPNRDLIDALVTSVGARRQPLIFYITTAGYDRNSICWELHDYALKVKAGIIDDPTFLPVVYAADEGDDWKDPASWAKANPGLGETVSLEYLAGECKRAQEVPAYENTFRRLHLDQWTQQATRWLPMDRWDACNEPVDVAALRGRPCYGGLDLSTTTDLSACAFVFPDGAGNLDVLAHGWIPEDNLAERERRDRVPYSLWIRQGHITATPGNVIDYAFIRQWIKDAATRHSVREIGYDPYNATQLVIQLQDQDGLTMVPVRQGYLSLSAPTKELLGLVLGRRIRHGANPVLRWAADNVMVTTDAAQNIKPDKEKSTQRIDPIVALIIALERASRAGNATSVYESRGIRTIG
jgi:phage terminase large subunit-like protein